MNYRICTAAFLFSVLMAWSGTALSQTKNDLNPDEMARLKFSVHLVTYDRTESFESALGEAYFQTMIFAFENTGALPELSLAGIPSHDLQLIEKYSSKLTAVKSNIPEWSFLLTMEAQYQKWLDSTLSKVSRFK